VFSISKKFRYTKDVRLGLLREVPTSLHRFEIRRLQVEHLITPWLEKFVLFLLCDEVGCEDKMQYLDQGHSNGWEGRECTIFVPQYASSAIELI
jgi:hypothetical protein